MGEIGFVVGAERYSEGGGRADEAGSWASDW